MVVVRLVVWLAGWVAWPAELPFPKLYCGGSGGGGRRDGRRLAGWLGWLAG